MGEERKQEEPNAEVNPKEKKEEKQEEKKKDEKVDDKAQEEKKEESEPSPPPAPLILSVNLHCVGCVKKIERIILKCKGVEGVEMDMGSDQVTVKGLVDPEALCSRIRKRTRKEVKLISPVLPPPAEGDPNKSQLVASQVGGLNTVELHVNMHCEACAQQLRRKILKMRGVQEAATDLSSRKVTVTGTMDSERLVKYVYKCTKRQAQVMPQPPKEEEETKEEPDKSPGDQRSAVEKPPEDEEEKEENKKEEKPEEAKQESTASEPQNGDKPPEGGGTEEKKDDQEGEGENKQGDEAKPATTLIGREGEDEEDVKKMITYYWAPVYTIERLPPPQLFSDENPNACSIS